MTKEADQFEVAAAILTRVGWKPIGQAIRDVSFWAEKIDRRRATPVEFVERLQFHLQEMEPEADATAIRLAAEIAYRTATSKEFNKL
jgi:hypothetical protein